MRLEYSLKVCSGQRIVFKSVFFKYIQSGNVAHRPLKSDFKYLSKINMHTIVDKRTYKKINYENKNSDNKTAVFSINKVALPLSRF